VNKDIAILNRLVIVLDDSRDFYADANRNLTSPHLRFLVRQFIHTHTEIANDLAERSQAQRMQPSRKGSTFGRWRARYAGWLAIVTPDIDLGYLIQIDRCETRVAAQFAAAVNKLRARWPQLRYDLDALECMQTQVAILVQKTQRHDLAR
jgi:uncharacterized protein (TIGR02284 family)